MRWGCGEVKLRWTSAGSFYNYFRDYDPSTGRYIQSDPIGLNGGMNTYAYVGSNPLSYSDVYGLISSAAKGIPNCWNQLLRTDRETFERVVKEVLDIYNTYEVHLLGLTPGGARFFPQPRLDPTPNMKFGVYQITHEFGIMEIYEYQRITKILQVYCEYKWKDECGAEQTSFDSYERSEVDEHRTLLSRSPYDEVISKILIGTFGL